ncbi:MAG: adenylyl-sulfate kinase [Candidatus Peribacteraceae bacterium]|jgi:adenylylsulfate kinase|nr:hypothetical protein [bacterium]MDP6561932.1 adenylyl-sulfate kinase [Candidatus Peribacteraceae bacterium]|tara:strand:- start:4922 stop:5419 length:498 start_codon:yes stop_codon:yes gene_type:complete
MSKRFPVIWLTGNSGAGKSTLAFAMREHINEQMDTSNPLARRVVVLDGDEMRDTVSRDEGFSPEDRRKHNMRVARLAALLRDSGYLVIVAVIAPFESVRQELQVMCDPTWVYIKRSGLGAEDRPYEAPENPDLLIDNDQLSIKEAQEKFKQFLESQLVVQEVAHL